jgi:hypothetical protein
MASQISLEIIKNNASFLASSAANNARGHLIPCLDACLDLIDAIANPFDREVGCLLHFDKGKSDRAIYDSKITIKVFRDIAPDARPAKLIREIVLGNFPSSTEETIFFGGFPQCC